MNRYESYKDSGVEWLGEVPSHWDEFPLFTQAKISSVINHTDKELLSVYLDKGVIKFSDVDEKRTNVTSLDLSKYQLVQKGNFVLNNQQAWRGSVGVSNYVGIVSPAYLVLELSNKFSSDYANYLFRNGSMIAHYLIASKGVGTIQRNLYWGNLRRAPVFIPPLSEQTTIAQYLDDKTAKIDQAIMLEEKQIELLKEHKQILIQNAVTKGLNPQVKFKDSGVEWLGEVPSHWEIIPNKYIFKLKKQVVGKNSSQYDLLSLTLKGIIKRDMENPEGKFPAEFDTYQEVKEGDFVFCLFDVEETPRTVGLSSYNGMITGAYTVFETNHVNKQFIYYFYLNLDNGKKLKPLYKGLRNTISKENFFSFNTFIPPLSEQTAIAQYLDEQTAKVDHAIQLKQQQIDKLKEYKTVLINDVVTGKVKVA